VATVDRKGRPHVVPTGFNLDTDKGVLEIGAHGLPDREQKRLYMIHIRANPYVAFVVDDLATEPTWAPRGVSVRGPGADPPGGRRAARTRVRSPLGRDHSGIDQRVGHRHQCL
jgi:pyridoxamine 5'-phosphate oxidase family protein